jgi:UDP-MurNAc hydroxylase
MRITGLGHASVFLETAHGTILTDPWVNPAYFGSWFPFPANSGLDWDRFGQADYLFVSHLHRDHFDPEHLRRHVSKSTTVLLPDFPTDELRDALLDIGFSSFVQPINGEVMELDGLQIMIDSLISPTDGPIGDSSLWVYDGEHRVLNQNDARPANAQRFTELGPIDGYLLQFSGAIWFPMVYELPERAKHALGVNKRQRQNDRSLRYIEEAQARFVFPTAGPPCFLDPVLFDLNDIHGDESNIFPDQTVYLDFLREHGHDEGRLLLPGSVADLAVEDCPVQHPYDPATIFASNDTKIAYLRDMQVQRMPEVEKEKLTWAQPGLDLVSELKAWLDPLLDEADHIAAGIDGGVRILAQEASVEDGGRGDVDVLIDFVKREVREYTQDKVRYEWRMPRAILEKLVADREIDWSNSVFLSCRFSAKRIGPYNEYVYIFFKCLSEERLQYAEGWFAEQNELEAGDVVRFGEWDVQRRCPHLKADLERFGEYEDGELTCQMHGWRWDLQSGRCITSVGHEIRATRVAD